MSDDDLPNEDENNVDGGEDEALSEDWAAAMAEAGETGEDDDDSNDDISADANPRAPLEEFEVTPPGSPSGAAGSDDTPNLDVILDIPVTISMEVGNTQIPIRNLLQLNQGSVIELDRLAGEPLDVLVNGTLIAHGEVVMVNEKFGIRLTDVVSQQERIQRLR
ncbi:flagellar motor switch protein FliN [Saccharospirillum sp. MSK14-1]|uniref:flagellar motor switch protein FliN n=1 Tax=Saccharospirillum sp. MSK14-1 TaxID=1897632 RepID=UPI000D3AB549|nr:flagellar motor switch protein FliN [Saccharospirillum sp. MSK14-1]PTY36754.1 flagellar motor switch protein FliN [Saccharospirillum sp. MSK14-1]